MKNEKPVTKIQIKQDLNANSLIKSVRNAFAVIPDYRRNNASISLADGLMSGFAIFSLKEQSLLDFEKNQNKHGDNLRSYHYRLKLYKNKMEIPKMIVKEMHPNVSYKSSEKIIQN